MKEGRSLLLFAASFWFLLILGCATAPVLHGIGVYEGSYPAGAGHSHDSHPDGNVDIEVHTLGHPVILALSSYEPVLWNIKPDEGVIMMEIILSCYHPCRVVGVDNSVRITRYKYSSGKRRFGNSREGYLTAELKAYTGQDFDSFQEMYTGKDFSVH